MPCPYILWARAGVFSSWCASRQRRDAHRGCDEASGGVRKARRAPAVPPRGRDGAFCAARQRHCAVLRVVAECERRDGRAPPRSFATLRAIHARGRPARGHADSAPRLVENQPRVTRPADPAGQRAVRQPVDSTRLVSAFRSTHVPAPAR